MHYVNFALLSSLGCYSQLLSYEYLPPQCIKNLLSLSRQSCRFQFNFLHAREFLLTNCHCPRMGHAESSDDFQREQTWVPVLPSSQPFQRSSVNDGLQTFNHGSPPSRGEQQFRRQWFLVFANPLYRSFQPDCGPKSNRQFSWDGSYLHLLINLDAHLQRNGSLSITIHIIVLNAVTHLDSASVMASLSRLFYG